MKKVFTWTTLVLTVLLSTVLIQNTESITVDFLFWHVQMPLIVLLFVVGALGVLFGIVLNLYLSSRKSRH